MKAVRVVGTDNIQLTLSVKQARFLRVVIQNPINQSAEDEPIAEARIRKLFWDTLGKVKGVDE